MKSWLILKEWNKNGVTHFVSRVDNPNERHYAPWNNFVEGVAHPPFVQQTPWAELKTTMVHRDSDIWIATFPKSGTSFTEQIVLLLIHGGDGSKFDNTTNNSFNEVTGIGKVWPERGPLHGMTKAQFDSLPSPRLLKTHAPRHLFLATRPVEPPSYSKSGRLEPLREGTKVIYVSRRADDACVSAYYHAANPHKFGFPFDAWAKFWLSGLFEHGRWSDHVAGWRAEALMNPDQVLWVRYEDLKADPVSQVKRIARFIGVDADDDSLIERVVASSRFDIMKSRAGSMSHFYRKGVVGDSAQHFSSALHEEFQAELLEQMRGVDDPYAPKK